MVRNISEGRMNFWRKHWSWIFPFMMIVSCSVPVLIGSQNCSHPKYEPYEVFNDEEMRQHVLSADCKLGEKLQCSESWGSSGCNKTHWTTCSCVETVKDHEAPRY